MSIIIFIIILAVLILVHEFGHFIVAKKSGIRVDEFGLGFPPKLFAKKWGDTVYTLNAIPFGGFVKIFGEDSHENISDSDKSTSFAYKPKWIQALVLVAGVTMNLLFAWFIISLGFMVGLPTPADSGLGNVTNVHVTVTEVLPNSPAEKAGLKAGDQIVSIVAGDQTLSGENIKAEDVLQIIPNSTSKYIMLTYSRGKIIGTAQIEPNTDIVAGKRLIGVGLDNIGTLRLSPIHAVIEGTRTTWLLLKATVIGLLEFLKNIFIFKPDFSQVTGIVGIEGTVSDARTLGFSYLLTLVALISINLAVINLLPFPALDGGRLLFVVIEAIIRRPINPSVVRWTNTIGFALLIILMIVVTGHDILKLL